jgi:alpha-ketoglutarate-dependent taurine dioxygenase
MKASPSSRGPSSIRRTGVSLGHGQLVGARPVGGSGGGPLLVEPLLEGVDLPQWIPQNTDFIERELALQGALLFRGFGLRDQADFEAALGALRIARMEYAEAATPRTRIGDRVYTSTEFPPEHSIALHNELSYVKGWPRRICFFCEIAPQSGGETPLADVRRVYRRIHPAFRARFEALGWLLVRNYNIGMGPTWQKSFHLADRASVEAYAAEADLDLEWGEGDRLRTFHRRPAVRCHPKTGEALWFNHVAFWHHSSLPDEVRQRLLAELGEGGLPYNTYYGDGSPIEDAVVEALRQAYKEETVAFPWQQGDFLLMDNMLVAHGRNPFSGPRRILTAMGNSSLDSGKA